MLIGAIAKSLIERLNHEEHEEERSFSGLNFVCRLVQFALTWFCTASARPG
jgi:hypothetical protein